MKIKIAISALLMLTAHQAKAQSSLIRSLERNLNISNQVLMQEKGRFERAKASYQSSKESVRSAKAILAKARIDELKQDRQIRAIADANAELYEIPDYRYDGNSTSLQYKK